MSVVGDSDPTQNLILKFWNQVQNILVENHFFPENDVTLGAVSSTMFYAINISLLIANK